MQGDPPNKQILREISLGFYSGAKIGVSDPVHAASSELMAKNWQLRTLKVRSQLAAGNISHFYTPPIETWPKIE